MNDKEVAVLTRSYLFATRRLTGKARCLPYYHFNKTARVTQAARRLSAEICEPHIPCLLLARRMLSSSTLSCLWAKSCDWDFSSISWHCAGIVAYL